MRTLSALVVLAGCATAIAADAPEDRAREAAVALLKAVKAKDAEAVLKLADVPFLYKDGGLATHKDQAALKTWLTEKIGEINDPERVPTTVDEVLTFASVKEKIKDATEKALAEEVIGKDGFLAVVTSADGKKAGIAVKMKDGKARVVGLIVR